MKKEQKSVTDLKDAFYPHNCCSKHVALNHVKYANFFRSREQPWPPHWTIHIASGANPVTLHARH